MPGIYLHIPFCRQACHYCGFHFSTRLESRDAMVQALQREAALQRDFFGAGSPPVGTIYFGGGTPSLLAPTQIAAMLETLRSLFPVEAEAEVTLEANPDDLHIATLKAWADAGVNRLSIGVQSLDDPYLRWMGRAHNACQALESIDAARAAGFDNLSVDLIYGLPELSDAAWAATLRRMAALAPPHLSCYALTVEPRTALAHAIRHHTQPAPEDERIARHFLLASDILQQAGYEHYEISNFSLPGRRSRHNSAYWSGEPYLGLGPSAHSYRGDIRQWNVSNNAVYLRSITGGKVPFEQETLSPTMHLNEYIMTALRTLEGCNLAHIEECWGAPAAAQLLGRAGKYLSGGQMERQGNRLVLRPEGRLFADGVAAALFA